MVGLWKSKKIALFLILVVGVVIVSGCIRDNQQSTTSTIVDIQIFPPSSKYENYSHCKENSDCILRLNPENCFPEICVNKNFPEMDQPELCPSICGRCCLNRCECRCINNSCVQFVYPKNMTTSQISSTSIMTTSTTIILRPIDIICPDDLEDFKERVEKNLKGEGVEEWFYKPITHKELGCSGNSIYCSNCSFFYPSFILTSQYNLTKLEVKARQKDYLIEKDGGFATKLAIIKKVSENESYWIGIKDVKANAKGHDVIAYQTGECCLDKEHIRSQVKEMMNDLDLEYSGLDESRIERAYVTGMVTARSTSNYDLDCDELKEDYVNICLEVKALMNDDPSLCNPDNFLCKAFVARDPSLCDKISDEYHKNTCISIFSTDPMDCLNLGSGRDIRCLSRKAVLFDNPSFCDELSGTSRSLCYDTVVILTRNTSLCGEGNVGCYGVIDLAIMSQDPSLCEKTFKRECYQTVYSETTLNSITQIFCDKINESDIRESCYRVASYWKKKPGFNNKYCEEDSDCISSSIDCVPGCWNRDRAQFTTKRCAFEEPQLSNCSCKNNICVTS